MNATQPTPITAVATSMSRIEESGITASNAADTAGIASMLTDSIVELIELTRSRPSSGTTSGMNAWTTGVCTPDPSERSTRTRRIAHWETVPEANPAARARVTTAMNTSGAMTSALRPCRSAHSPTTGEMSAAGSVLATSVTVVVRPELVCMTIHQLIAYWTMVEPSSENVCPTTSSAAAVRHDY